MKRTRAHELESESRSRFKRAILEKKWLSRDLDDDGDYGIDEEVEIFEGGETTGLVFRVQVKSMERPDSIGPYVDVRLEHFDYWHSLGLPVLLVMWVAEQDILYAKWVHRYDFGRGGVGEVTYRVRFSEVDRLDSRIETIATEVQLFRALGESGLSKPILLAIDLPENPDLQLPFAYALRKAIEERRLRPYVRLETGQDARALVVRVTDSHLRVELPADAGSVNAHVEAGFLSPHAWAKLSGEILVGIGILASRLGSSTEAARIISTVDPKSLLTSLPYAQWIVDAFLRVEEVEWLVRKLCVLLTEDDDLDVEEFQVYLEPVDLMAERLASKDLRALRRATKRRVDRDKQHKGLVARLEHNLAALAKGANRWDLAEAHLKRAVDLDPDGYGKRPDVAIFRGNARWHAGDFEGARSFYEQACDSGAEPAEYIDPLSDVLMELGHYAAAAQLIDDLIETEDGNVSDRAVLRRIVLADIIDGVGVGSQERTPLSEHAFGDSGSWNPNRITELLRDTDALDGRLWELVEQDSTGAGPSYIGKFGLAAYRSNHPGMWLLLLISAIAAGIDEWIIERLKFGAFESPGIVEMINDIADVSDLAEFSEIVQSLRLEAFSHTARPEVGRCVHLVDESNEILSTISFGIDGEILDVSPLPAEVDG